jgi:predicted transcriptional regulator
MPQKTKPPLSALENTVMNIVWNHSEVTAEWVRQALASKPRMKDSTVRTSLRRLETKGMFRTAPRAEPTSTSLLTGRNL